MNKVLSVLENGSQEILVEVESHLSNSLPNIMIVGFANKSVDEAKERIRSALTNSQIKLPKKRITVNLAPADIPKEGSYFDLAILISILISGDLLKNLFHNDTVVLGEVGLSGEIRPIRGIIGKILASKKLGINNFVIPYKNLPQADLIPDISVLPVKNVKQLVNILNSEDKLIFHDTSSNIIINDRFVDSITIDDVMGQETAKRALIIAASGHHNIMLNGQPGAGKTMLAKCLPGIMPELLKDEVLEITHIHSLANKNYEKIITQRPFRSPHHSASNTSIVGGGQNPKPGEISLAHHGVLMFDEFPEFNRSVIESLRQPLEDKKISVSRTKDTIEFPANFILAATSNPCPCGFFGSSKTCTCLPTQILKYQRKTSGPIMDRIDLYVDVEEINHSQLMQKHRTNNLENIRKAVSQARKTQFNRAGKLNSQLTNKDLQKLAKLDVDAKNLLDSASAKLQLSPRAYIRSLRVARTIADLENSEIIKPEHISEALQYRKRTVEF